MRDFQKKSKTMTKKMVIGVMAILFTCLCATASFANFSMGFSENGIYNGTTYNITKIEVFDLGGNRDFASPGASNFSNGTWTVQMPSANYVVATTSPTGAKNFDWTLYLTGNQNGATLNLAYLAYTSTSQVYGTYMNLSNGSWAFPTISPFSANDPRFVALRGGPAAVPVPPAVFLFGTGLIGLAALRKKIQA
jgi:hypothetical protein